MLREKFLRAYANLPIKTREEIIAVIGDEPMTWNVAYQEIKNNTPLGQEILEKLKKLGME